MMTMMTVPEHLSRKNHARQRVGTHYNTRRGWVRRALYDYYLLLAEDAFLHHQEIMFMLTFILTDTIWVSLQL